jgi:hypothetical protein
MADEGETMNGEIKVVGVIVWFVVGLAVVRGAIDLYHAKYDAGLTLLMLSGIVYLIVLLGKTTDERLILLAEALRRLEKSE